MRRTLVTSALLALLVPLLSAVPSPSAGAVLRGPASSSAQTSAEAAARLPALRVTTRVSGLNHPWDAVQLPSGALLITERDPARLTLAQPGGGGTRTVGFPSDRVWTSGETGLMGLEVDPGFATNRRIYTCSGWIKRPGQHDIRVNAWRLAPGGGRVTLVNTLVAGLPTTSGRHGGCRLLVTRSGALVVGTGDAAVGRNPRDKRSLGGKTLRVNRFTGDAWPTNPFIRSDSPNTRKLLTYGHRNVQGLAQRNDGTLWSVEHGSYRDDEVNRLVAGGDYGWNPVPGYDESVPMTDFSLPGKQYGARWRSGDPTVATSGATFVYGRRWGALDGALAVAVLKDERLLFMRFGPRGFDPQVTAPAALLGRYGRLRTAVRVNGGLLVLTDADGGAGRALLVRPQ